jgi:hypothetical protein
MTKPSRAPLVALPDLLNGLNMQGLEMRMLELSLQQRWVEIVGVQIANHTYPETIRFRRLYLLAANSVWLQQLLFLKVELLEKIHAALGQDLLADIVLRVGAIPIPSMPPENTMNENLSEGVKGLSHDTQALLQDSLSGVADLSLVEHLRSLLVNSAHVQTLICRSFPETTLDPRPVTTSLPFPH